MRHLSVIVAVLAAGCETAAKPAPAAVPDAPAPGAASIESASFVATLNVDLAASTKTGSGLYYRDLAVGTGAAVATGQRVSVHYVGSLPDGAVFDQNTAADPPYAFTPGAGRVITGWEEGVLGMKVGGKRQLIVPPALGYGAGGRGPIPPDAILVFTVEVVDIQ